MAARRPARDLNVPPGKGTGRSQGSAKPAPDPEVAERRKRSRAAKKAAATRQANAERDRRSEAAQRGAERRRLRSLSPPPRPHDDEWQRLAKDPKAPPEKDRRPMIGGDA